MPLHLKQYKFRIEIEEKTNNNTDKILIVINLKSNSDF